MKSGKSRQSGRNGVMTPIDFDVRSNASRVSCDDDHDSLDDNDDDDDVGEQGQSELQGHKLQGHGAEEVTQWREQQLQEHEQLGQSPG